MASLMSSRIESFKLLAQTGINPESVVILEAFAWHSSVKKGILHGIPVWSYSNGTTLFETDKHETHQRELLSSYLDTLGFIQSLLLDAYIKNKLDSEPYKISEFDPSVDPRSSSSYLTWQKEYLDSITCARKVLQETVELKDAFIICKKCKSSEVDTEQKQTRSADEPMTIFCKCRKCQTCFRID
jgi:DNA-directed RNA polymerase subunit M/transcription elongation factor TFIIS